MFLDWDQRSCWSQFPTSNSNAHDVCIYQGTHLTVVASIHGRWRPSKVGELVHGRVQGVPSVTSRDGVAMWCSMTQIGGAWGRVIECDWHTKGIIRDVFFKENPIKWLSVAKAPWRFIVCGCLVGYTPLLVGLLYMKSAEDWSYMSHDGVSQGWSIGFDSDPT